ncbi:porin [uncultured Cohaesibacter sp.]|uniref:porin n=1 Tax=uncultured Cohaesibacter sp. TaxID=1002546 RepID=UPI00292CB89D|nr:porin [uncultured Cohaesibacter sp.]
MNIKSLILGSAAALVVGGAAQAADLPVAEPVDYVKVCDAYGAGYFFIPGTDTCLKISGYVRTEARFNDTDSRSEDKFDLWARGQVNFDAKEETELGTLASRVRIEGEDDGAIKIAKAYLTLGGFYAGYLTSGGVVDYVGDLYGGDYDLGDTTIPQFGYNLALGNGVTATLGISNNKHSGTDVYAGQTLPTLVARMKVDQAWGSLAVGAVLGQLRYANADYDSDVAYSVAAGGEFNLDSLSAGSAFAFNGFYSSGAFAWNGISNGDYLGDVSAKADGSYAVNDAYGLSASLKVGLADNVWTVLSGGYAQFNDEGVADNDYDIWSSSLEFGYEPVKNLKIMAGVQYTDVDFDNGGDTEDWEGKLRIQRNF